MCVVCGQGVYEVDDEEIYDAPGLPFDFLSTDCSMLLCTILVEPDDIDSHREYLADESV